MIIYKHVTTIGCLTRSELISQLPSADQSTGCSFFLPDGGNSRPQAFVQLGEDLLLQQRHQSGVSHRGAEQGCQGWYPAHTTGVSS